ncbi:hypothetical protein [Methylomarinum vadi]|uniref:hypothetical protein n=1 Tax=Methylomarinum vadi TaxID=438855 RepID=UPI0004DED562|nr:hypothetical protein [Methylomarinum vadi]
MIIALGPIKEDEAWVKQTFSLPEKNVPSFGLGVDIDSHASNIEIASDSQIAKSISAIFDLTKATESEVVTSFMEE